jgi:hypothetical protein
MQHVIDVAKPARGERTFLTDLVFLGGAAAIALLVPFVILLIGVPIALAVRVVVEPASGLALILG